MTRAEIIAATKDLYYGLIINNSEYDLSALDLSDLGYNISTNEAINNFSTTQLVVALKINVYNRIRQLSDIYFAIYGVHLMSAIAAIVINDGAATPVAHTFNPVASSPDALYRENISGLALTGQGTLKLAVVGDKGNGLNKVRLTIDLPALEVVTGQNSLGYSAAPKVAYSDKVNVDFILPSRATSQQRKDLRVLLINALANAQVIDAVENLNVPY